MTDRPEDDEISLLDIGVVVAEAWKLLLIVPLLAGLVAFAASYAARTSASAQVATATMLVSLSRSDLEVLKTPAVLRAPMNGGGWLDAAGGDSAAAWTNLAESLATRRIGDALSTIYRLDLSHRTPAVATRTLELIVAQLQAERGAAPPGTVAPPIEVLETARLAPVASPLRPALITGSLVALAVAILLLAGALVRDALRRAEPDGAAREKLARIRQAFGAKRG